MIKKYGKVIITEKETHIESFHFEEYGVTKQVGNYMAKIEALQWAHMKIMYAIGSLSAKLIKENEAVIKAMNLQSLPDNKSDIVEA